jgi:hypothetical protein
MNRAILIFLLSAASLAWSAEKDSEVSGYLSILQRLQQCARENRDSDPQPKLRAAIDALLPDMLSSDQLLRLGISTSLIAYPQEAGSDIPFDGVFADASRRCAILLSTRSDDDSADYLRRMQPICGPDGGEHQMYEDLIARQEQLRKNNKTK